MNGIEWNGKSEERKERMVYFLWCHSIDRNGMQENGIESENYQLFQSISKSG
jgi:hypothetical protein